MYNNKRIRVLHIIDSDRIGGVQELIKGLVKYYNRDKFYFELWVLRGINKEFRDLLISFGLAVKVLNYGYRQLWRLLAPPLSKKDQRFDILHTHINASFVWGTFWRKNIADKMLFSIPHTRDQCSTVGFYLYKIISRKDAFFFALSKTVENDLVDIGVKKNKIITVP
ncbi:MAG: glycosyltransferase, partial [bacterium]